MAAWPQGEWKTLVKYGRALHRGVPPPVLGNFREGTAMAADDDPFWRRKPLANMTDSEWESLCDGCGRCCLVKLEDADDSARTYFTDVGCRLLDAQSCRCRDYAHRTAKVKDCVRLTPRNINRIVWLPPTCAYRLLADGHDLYWWHPLVSGDPETVHQAGISVRGKVGACEDEVRDEELEDRIVSWPLRVPKAARKPPRP
jgi:uncharacterized cysteine cluster protein YcgN (CxxCxxCC family)